MEEEGHVAEGGRLAGGHPRVEQSRKPVVEEEGARMGYVTMAEKLKLNALGGKISATHRRLMKSGERPRLLGDAIRDDLTGGIDEFMSQGCMQFSSFRAVWQSRSLSTLHLMVPNRVDDRHYVQQAFSIGLDLLLKDETVVAAAGEGDDGAGASAGACISPSSPSSGSSAGSVLPVHDLGPGSLPFQIGALYTIYCLHATQLFRPMMPVRVSAQAMLALVRLRARLKAAGPLARDALAVLARLVLGNSGSLGGVGREGVGVCGGGGGGIGAADHIGGIALLAAAFSGPGTIGFVDSTIPLTKLAKVKRTVRSAEDEARKVERAMAMEAKAAGAKASVRKVDGSKRTREGEARPPSGGVPTAAAIPAAAAAAPAVAAAAVKADMGSPRMKAEATIEAVSTQLEKLSSTYEEYAAALKRTDYPNTASAEHRRDIGGDSGSGINNGGRSTPASDRSGSADSSRRSPTASRSDYPRRDVADALDRTRLGLPLPEAYGLERLALRPPAPPPPPTSPKPPTFSLDLPTLPELPPPFENRRAVAKRPVTAAAAAARARAGPNANRSERAGGGAVGVRDHLKLIQQELEAGGADDGSSSSDSSSSSSSGELSADGGANEASINGRRQGRMHSDGSNTSVGADGGGRVRLPGGLGNGSSKGGLGAGGRGRGDRSGGGRGRGANLIDSNDSRGLVGRKRGAPGSTTTRVQADPRTGKKGKGKQSPNPGKRRRAPVYANNGSSSSSSDSFSEEEGGDASDMCEPSEDMEAFAEMVAKRTEARSRSGGGGRSDGRAAKAESGSTGKGEEHQHETARDARQLRRKRPWSASEEEPAIGGRGRGQGRPRSSFAETRKSAAERRRSAQKAQKPKAGNEGEGGRNRAGSTDAEEGGEGSCSDGDGGGESDSGVELLLRFAADLRSPRAPAAAAAGPKPAVASTGRGRGAAGRGRGRIGGALGQGRGSGRGRGRFGKGGRDDGGGREIERVRGRGRSGGPRPSVAETEKSAAERHRSAQKMKVFEAAGAGEGGGGSEGGQNGAGAAEERGEGRDSGESSSSSDGDGGGGSDSGVESLFRFAADLRSSPTPTPAAATGTASLPRGARTLRSGRGGGGGGGSGGSRGGTKGRSMPAKRSAPSEGARKPGAKTAKPRKTSNSKSFFVARDGRAPPPARSQSVCATSAADGAAATAARSPAPATVAIVTAEEGRESVPTAPADEAVAAAAAATAGARAACAAGASSADCAAVRADVGVGDTSSDSGSDSDAGDGSRHGGDERKGLESGARVTLVVEAGEGAGAGAAPNDDGKRLVRNRGGNPAEGEGGGGGSGDGGNAEKKGRDSGREVVGTSEASGDDKPEKIEIKDGPGGIFSSSNASVNGGKRSENSANSSSGSRTLSANGPSPEGAIINAGSVADTVVGGGGGGGVRSTFGDVGRGGGGAGGNSGGGGSGGGGANAQDMGETSSDSDEEGED